MRAASRLSLKVLRFESDLCELKRLLNEVWSWIFDGKNQFFPKYFHIKKYHYFNNLSIFVLALFSREPPHFYWSMFMFRKRRTENGKQASEAGGYYHKVAAS